jgi:hypothetical protein
MSQFDYYLMNQAVIVIYKYPKFGLTKIRYQDSCDEFIIDTKLLADKPTSVHTINLGLLG